MDCIKVQKLIRPYLEGQLSDRELEEFLNHVENCRECHDELEIYFSIYQTLGDEDDDGDYNFTRKLEQQLKRSRDYLRRRHIWKSLRILAAAVAEAFFLAAASGLLRGSIEDWRERLRVEEDSEAATETESLQGAVIRQRETEGLLEADSPEETESLQGAVIRQRETEGLPEAAGAGQEESEETR